jgi:hypothetical protein
MSERQPGPGQKASLVEEEIVVTRLPVTSYQGCRKGQFPITGSRFYLYFPETGTW